MDNLETYNMNVSAKEKIDESKILNSVVIEENDGNKIKKILTVCAKPCIENITAGKNEVKVNGYVEYNLLLVFENDSIEPFSQKANFSKSFETTNILENDKIRACCNILEVNTIGEENFTIESTVNCEIYKIGTNDSITCAMPKENVFTKSEKVDYFSFVNSTDYNAEVSFEIAKDNKFNKVLFVTSEISVKSVMPAMDYFVVGGEVYTTIIYQNEEGQIKSVVKENEFSEEIESKGVNKESILQVNACIKENKIVENMENNQFNFVSTFTINADIFNSDNCESIVDAYSVLNEIELKKSDFVKEAFFSTRQFESVVTANTSLSENLKNVDKILAVVPNYVTNLNQVVEDGNILFEGIASVNIIYYSIDEDGQEVLNSMDVEVPYSLKFNVDDVKDWDLVCSKINIKDISVKNKMGRELEILVEFNIDYNLSSKEKCSATTQIIVGKEKEKPDYALEICLSNNEEQSLWDIAKRLNISLEDLTRQNGELSLPIMPGEKFVAYNQNTTEIN